jgi:hypothetical protein
MFAYTVSMFTSPTSGVYPFVIVCKGCQQNILAPVQTLPGSWRTFSGDGYAMIC